MRSESHLLAILLLAASLPTRGVHARDFRVNQLPNGQVASCNTCHLAGGGTPRNPFGLDVFAITGFVNRPFWSAALAQMDSDGDGFTNGEELGDPDGDGIPAAGAQVTNPGNPNSKPAVNAAPTFTSSPVTEATIGLPYVYAATASDPENRALTYSKIEGPEWLSVSSTGAVAGTPPDLAAGELPVVLRVTDQGSPPKSTDQAYVLRIAASLAGWQALQFNLPAEAELAQPLADPDGDGLANLGEYALRLNPRVADAPGPVVPRFAAEGDISLQIAVRDDDPSLDAELEASNDASFDGAQITSRTVSDPVPGDGLQTLEFVDTVKVPQLGASRFWRLRLRLNP